MAKYIPLDAVLAEIKRRYKLVDKYETNEFCAVASRYELVHIKNFINTLEVKEEVKEVDLEKEYKVFVEEDSVYNKLVNGIVGKAIAKHFFELGIQQSKNDNDNEEKK